MYSFNLFWVGFVIVIYFILQEIFGWNRRYNNNSYSSMGWNRAEKRQERVSKNEKIKHRKSALNHAQKFLKPFNDLMGEFCLVNDNCKVSLIIVGKDKKQIIGVNKHTKDGKKEFFTAKISKEYLQYYSQTSDYVVDFLWDTICMNFNDITAYENIVNAVRNAMLDVQESGLETDKNVKKVNNLKINSNNLLNINSASENELLAMPGINIIQAKKIRKYIEKNGEFASVEEFFEKMNIKDVFAQQIRGTICVKSVEQTNVQQVQITETESIPENSLEIEQKNGSKNENYFNPHSDNERTIDL